MAGLKAPNWLVELSQPPGQRLWVVLALVAVSMAAWLAMFDMATGEMHLPAAATAAAWVAGFVMWSIMMIAMMLPTVAPMLLVFARVCERNPATQGAPAAGRWSLFAGGYLVVWIGFSLLAASLQWVLVARGVLTHMGVLAAPLAAGSVAIAAGLYQLTPLKNACLRSCQSPLGYLLIHWREGLGGAFRMGLHHGVICAGCCWALMALMFVGGVMSLLWMAGITAFVLLEKLAAPLRGFPQFAGGVLVFAGIAMLVRSWMG